MKIYRALLHLYPQRFRLEYGDDMVALLEDQLRDEPTLRVVGRAVLDLIVSVPTRRLEAHMRRSTTAPLVITFVAVAAALVVFGGLLGLGGAVLLLALAALIRHQDRPIVGTEGTRWWKLLSAGVFLLGALVVVTSVAGELPEGGWFVAMATMFTSLGLIGTGVALGIVGRLRSVHGA